MTTLATKDLLTAAELPASEVLGLFNAASVLKANPARYAAALAGKAIIMLFEKPSLRTRVSFEVGIARLGAHPVYFDHSKERIGERESVFDYARNLERWCDAIVARTYSHPVLEQLAGFSRIPVINALSDEFHPCQALADLFTLHERLGNLAGRRFAFIGDGNNVCASLAVLAPALGVHMTIISPQGYELSEPVLEAARRRAAEGGGSITTTRNPASVAGADAVYTDAWTSMGWEAEAQERRKVFGRYQVDSALMSKASPSALFMHCLPAHRGEEVTDEVIDSPQSIVFDQAENRMHAQNALLLHLLTCEPRP